MDRDSKVSNKAGKLGETTSKAQSPDESDSCSISDSISQLSICRNKHWRFISAFHGQWLNFTLDRLEEFAQANYFSSRPLPIDAAVLFDAVRIRRLVDEAADFSVRAVNGITAAALNASLHGDHDSRRGGGREPTMSNAHRSRLRCLAVERLAEAYRLDDIAASVATMQASSSLEDVAGLLLQWNPQDKDNANAKYVHFFHEKIPSRALAESTSLEPLDDLLQDCSHPGPVLRTRACTRIFKEDYKGAAKDLTEALKTIRQDITRHPVLPPVAKPSTPDPNTPNSRENVPKLKDSQKPTGLEAQLYFQRAGVYLSLACQYAESAFKVQPQTISAAREADSPEALDVLEKSDPAFKAYGKVKACTKSALQDYTRFLSKIEYCCGGPQSNGDSTSTEEHISRLVGDVHIESPASDDTNFAPSSNASTDDTSISTHNTSLPVPKIYPVSELFTPTPPGNLPPFPANSLDPAGPESVGQYRPNKRRRGDAERITYHPLLTEALHGILLCHALLQTEMNLIRKHALMAARLISLADGRPTFAIARSSSRVDWVDVLKQTNDWIDLKLDWEQLCELQVYNHRSSIRNQPAKRPGKKGYRRAPPHKIKDVDDRLETNRALRAAAAAMNPHAEVDLVTKELNTTAKIQQDLDAYSLGTERADIISKWIQTAPVLPNASGKPRKGKKRKTAKTSVQAAI